MEFYMRHSVEPPKKASATRNSTSSTKPVRRRSRRKPGLAKSIPQLLLMTFFGRLVIGIMASGFILLADLLIASYQFDLFFKLVGIELIIAGMIFWIRFLVHTRPTGKEQQSKS